MLSIIVAVDENNAIGKDNELLWYITEDLRRFKTLTNGHPVIMGRKTFESIGKALPGRINIIISRNPLYRIMGSIVVASLEAAISTAFAIDDNPFIIGGASVYQAAMSMADTIYLTTVHRRYDDADTFFPEIPASEWHEVDRINYDRGKDFDYPFSFSTFIRHIHKT
jgi:dihydrofolate reductase